MKNNSYEDEMKLLKYEFNTWEELIEAEKHLEDYHDCPRCHGKIVMIHCDAFGNTYCGYCKQMVKYPRMKKEAFEKMIKEKIKCLK